jgi:hypothetical protein
LQDGIIPAAKTPWINAAPAAIKPTAEKSGKANDKPFRDVERMKQD